MEGEFLEFKDLDSAENISFIMTPNQIKNVLNIIGNGVDKKGYIVDLKTKERVLTPEFEEIKLNQLGAILPGSKIFITKNIASFSQYLVKRKRKERGI